MLLSFNSVLNSFNGLKAGSFITFPLKSKMLPCAEQTIFLSVADNPNPSWVHLIYKALYVSFFFTSRISFSNAALRTINKLFCPGNRVAGTTNNLLSGAVLNIGRLLPQLSKRKLTPIKPMQAEQPFFMKFLLSILKIVRYPQVYKTITFKIGNLLRKRCNDQCRVGFAGYSLYIICFNRYPPDRFKS